MGSLGGPTLRGTKSRWLVNFWMRVPDFIMKNCVFSVSKNGACGAKLAGLGLGLGAPTGSALCPVSDRTTRAHLGSAAARDPRDKLSFECFILIMDASPSWRRSAERWALRPHPPPARRGECVFTQDMQHPKKGCTQTGCARSIVS